MSFEESLKFQNAAFSQLDACISNYKKTPKERFSAVYIETRIKTLENCWKLCFDNHTKLLMNAQSVTNATQHEYFKKEFYDTYENEYINALTSMRTKLEEYVRTSQIHEDGTGFENSLIPVARISEPRPPSMPVPKFSGDYKSWSSFYDMFTVIIHDSAVLKPVEKLYHLKASLSGEAETLLRHYQITNDNYEPAWEQLKQRFENKRILVNAQLSTLLSQTPIKSDTADSIRKLLDTTNECICALSNLGIDVSTWDSIIIFSISQKLSFETLQFWEQSLGSKTTLPTFNEFKEFLESRFRTLEMINNSMNKAIIKHDTASNNLYNRNVSGNNNSLNNTSGNPFRSNRSDLNRNFNTTSRPSQQTRTYHNQSTFNNCTLCDEQHSIWQCSAFIQQSHSEKVEFVKIKGLCLNCLQKGHVIATCPSKRSCFHCSGRHHTLLHIQNNTMTNDSMNTTSQSATHNVSDDTRINTLHVHRNCIRNQVLLATALVKVTSPNNDQLILRALLDQGSEASFISEAAVQHLKLKKSPIHLSLSGLGGVTTGESNSVVTFRIGAIHAGALITMQAFVLRTLTKTLPERTIHNRQWRHLNGIELADPRFFESNTIDLLLGADVYAQIIMDGVRKGEIDDPIAQKTLFGWVLSGQIGPKETSSNSNQSKSITILHNRLNLDEQIKRFWELEEIPMRSSLTEDEKRCEDIFQKTHTRNSDGRYKVTLPFNIKSDKTFGRSRHIAMARFLSLESQLNRNNELKLEYSKCINEYLTLGHMKPVVLSENQHAVQSTDGAIRYSCNYLPHHAVFKESSTTRTRIVFNASNKNSDKQSLNDQLLIGPTIQENMASIILRWRKYKVVFTADIHKMYRQIEVTEKDADYQRILWRNNSNEIIKDYCLSTVTFGTSSAPFLAIRTLQQLAKDEMHRYPIAAQTVLSEFYVDDLLTGADTISEAIEKQLQLICLMKSGKLELRKWSANRLELLEFVPTEHIEMKFPLDIETDSTIKALGVHWNPVSDTFGYKLKIASLENKNLTKRNLLSSISKLFDPIGWIAPVIITAKILIQQMWLTGLNWDDELPLSITEKWNLYRSNLQVVERLEIPRWFHTDKYAKVEIHGFCDASLSAYAAAVYIRCQIGDDVKIELLTAKSKVAPLKSLTLPKLELRGAVLLSKLMKNIVDTLQIDNVRTFAWCDSEIVLAWLRGHPNRWTTFVSNHVAQVHENLKNNTWLHITSSDNPADCASRGMSPSDLEQHALWWNGPMWLKLSEKEWPIKSIQPSSEVELRAVSYIILNSSTNCCENDQLLEKYSSIKRLIRVTGFCLRFIHNCRKKGDDRNLKWLLASEIQIATTFWIRHSQEKHFADEIGYLKNGQPISVSSRIICLNPFLDNDGILRVGGRIQRSELAFGEKHPILLHDKSLLALRMIDQYHNSTLHGGPQLMIASIRRKYWILNIRNTVRNRIRKCVICRKQKATCAQQLMADLPKERIVRSKPFFHTGVDYCGPFEIKANFGRSPKMVKAYIAIFVCMAVKAVHIELVSSLTTDAFIAAFRRFIGRRGYSGHIHVHSDNGSNFVGADRELAREINLARMNVKAAEIFADEGISWHFIPPTAATFGGLWEAGVKSTKYHLKRVLGNSRLTYEEFTTVLVQIEACLNSRPLCPISSDSRDFNVLTPGHFLTGDALQALPEPSLVDIKDNHLNRWQYLQKLQQHFWKFWSSDYLAQLQQRPKRLSKEFDNVKIGSLVLVKNENLPSCKWLLARVVNTHAGDDGLVRVVTIRTKDSEFKRPINKLCVLPIDEDIQDH